MNQMALFRLPMRVWTVGDLTRVVRQLLESHAPLQDVWVAGEVSNVSRPSSGHLYFTLKDLRASLRCVMWRTEVEAQVYLPREGEAVEAHGHISVYDAAGQYQLYADAVRRAGEGVLYQEFLRLKAKLEAEGLFDPARKRPLPEWPARIGLVTSPTGAALRDVLHVLRRRFPLTEVILSPSPVQGEEAPAALVEALDALNAHVRPDVILLVRGGGSMEDLAAFNDEGLARAVARSAAPVVTGVGHETDLVIVDFVADRRAPTPSAAAEIATPDRAELLADVRGQRVDLAQAFARRLRELRRELDRMQLRLRAASPRAQLAGARQRLDDLQRRAVAALRHGLALRRQAVARWEHTLQAVGPQAVLARGFAIVTRVQDGAVVRSVGQVGSGDEVQVRVSDGAFGAQVRE